MSQYYRGGSKVANTSKNAPIPTSGTIRYSNFRGTGIGGGAMTATDSGDIYSQRANGGSLSGTHQIFPSGGSGSYTYTAQWISGGTSMVIGGGGNATCSITSTYNGSGSVRRSGTLRRTVSDGSTTITFDRSVIFEWGTPV